MTENNIQEELVVNNQKIRVVIINGREYISLTDLARYADPDEPRFQILNWMRNKDVISYLGLWEELNNKNFNRVEFGTVKNESGRYDSGTYAFSDIARSYVNLYISNNYNIINNNSKEFIP